MMKSFLSCLALAAVFTLSACSAGVTMSSSSMQRELDQLKMEVADLKDQGRGGDAAPADLRMDINQLRTDVQRLNESIEAAGLGGLSLRQQLEYTNARLDRLEKKAGLQALDTSVIGPVESPLVISGPPAAPGGPPPPPPVIAPQADQPESAAAAPAPVAPAPVATTPYDQGRTLFDQRDYQGAAAKFRESLAASPKGQQAPAAQFYIGESLFAQQKYEEAILEYHKVVQGFPKSTQVPTSLLKQALAFQAIGDKESARLLYEKVTQTYPKSYAAGVAKERLKTI